ncbi:MAG: hypothetical protein KGQ60_06125 [Planctomycetes bacterium]|nr:hypothetical protein [Planctomycetota bacterium]
MKSNGAEINSKISAQVPWLIPLLWFASIALFLLSISAAIVLLMSGSGESTEREVIAAEAQPALVGSNKNYLIAAIACLVLGTDALIAIVFTWKGNYFVAGIVMLSAIFGFSVLFALLLMG